MKTKALSVFCNSHSSPVLAAIACVALGSGFLHASTLLVNWGGNYVDNDQTFGGSYSSVNGIDLDNDSVNDDSRFGYAYNAGSPSPLNPSSGYSGSSGTFYGGFAISTINNADSTGETLQPNGQGVHQNGPNDHIKFQTQHDGNHHHTFALFTYWDKADFLNGGSGNPISLDSTSTLSLDIRNNTNINEGTHLHFVVRNGTQFYVSEAFWSGTNPGGETGYQAAIPEGGTATLNPLLSGLGWKTYDPDGLDLQWDHGGWSPQTFDDVTSVGFYMDTLAFSQNNNDLELTGFRFSAIPEPSSALIAMAGLGVMALRRRRA